MRLPVLSALLLAAAPLAAPAQPTTVDGRVNKLEREMRAVQRKVFPEGSQQLVEPDIRPAAPPPAPVGAPASGALNDLTSRVDGLERQVQQITNQVEQNQFKLRQLEERLNVMAQAQAAAAAPVIDAPPPPSGGFALPPAGPRTGASATPRQGAPAVSPPRAGMPAGSPFASQPTLPLPADAADAAPVSTGDPAEDAYLAGYRLWEQKRFPEAQAMLKDAAQKYPKHRRYSYAQNLLGRAYLDEGKPALAAEALYANYRTMPRGERAPDSLYFLGQSLVKLKKTGEACRVYDELRDVYGETMAASLKTRVTAARTEAKCGA